MSLTIDEETYKQRKKKSLVKQICILLVISLIGMFIMLILLFILIRNTPNSPYSTPLSEMLSQEMIDLWGLDKTPFQQFFIFLWNLISGNCGESLIIRRGVPVKELIIERFPIFLEFNLISFYFSLLLGVLFGVCAFKFRDKWSRKIPNIFKRLNWAILIIGLGSFFQYTIGYKLGLLPTTMFYDPNYELVPPITNFRLLDCLIAGNFVAFWDTFIHLIMPVFCQGFIMFSFITELTYSIIDFYKSRKEMPFLSGKIGFYLSFIFTTTLFIEYTFHIQGIGMLTVFSIYTLDIFLASSAFYHILLAFIIINVSINFLLLLIPFIVEFVKKSKMSNNKEVSTISSESPESDSDSNLQETASEPIFEENSLVLEKIDGNTISISKKIIKSVKHKLKNPLTILGILLLLLIFILALCAKSIAPYDYESLLGTEVTAYDFSPPSAENIFGVTKYGRDVYSRCLYGLQTTLKVGFISSLIGMPLGVLMGLVSAFFGKWVKYAIDTINGIILFVPGSLFVFFIISIVGNDFHNFYWIYGLISLPITILFTQQAISYEMKKGEILPRDFTKSNGRKILNRLPNIILSIIGVGCLVMGLAILSFESLNWLGIGDPSVIILGSDLNIARARITSAPWALFWPVSWIYITVLGFIMVGIGLKEE